MARRLAVAATRICWTHGEGQTELVTRAIGDARVGHQDSIFLDVSQNGLVLNQISLEPTPRLIVRAMASECREHPDVFSFFSPQSISIPPELVSIKIQVNFDRRETADRTGSFDLWVKVVD